MIPWSTTGNVFFVWNMKIRSLKSRCRASKKNRYRLVDSICFFVVFVAFELLLSCIMLLTIRTSFFKVSSMMLMKGKISWRRRTGETGALRNGDELKIISITV